MHARRAETISLAKPQGAEFGLANAVAFASIVWNTGLQLAGRARDDPQHLRGRGLLLQRLR